MPEGEKQRVYAELATLRSKLAKVHQENRDLRASATAKESAILRREGQQYRKALSNILHRLDNGGVDDETLRGIVKSALLLKGLKAYHRDEIAAVHQGGGSGA